MTIQSICYHEDFTYGNPRHYAADITVLTLQCKLSAHFTYQSTDITAMMLQYIRLKHIYYNMTMANITFQY